MEPRKETEFSPSQCRFHCWLCNNLSVWSVSQTLRACFSSLAYNPSWGFLRSSLSTHTNVKRKKLNGGKKKKREICISLQSAKEWWFPTLPSISIHLQIWASFPIKYFLTLSGLSERTEGNSCVKIGIGPRSL